MTGDFFGKRPCRRRRRSLRGKECRSAPLEPEKVESYVGGLPGGSHEVVEERSPGLVGRNHLPIKNDALATSSSADTAWQSASKRLRVLPFREDELAACPLLEIDQGPKTVVLESKSHSGSSNGSFPEMGIIGCTRGSDIRRI
jgi:hypothetical protein